MYFMACYDLDRFRRFVFETKFLEMFDVEEERVEALRTDDIELLEFAMQWLRFCTVRREAAQVKPKVMDAWQRHAAEQGLTTAEQ